MLRLILWKEITVLFGNNDLRHEDKTVAQFPTGPPSQPARGVSFFASHIAIRHSCYHLAHSFRNLRYKRREKRKMLNLNLPPQRVYNVETKHLHTLLNRKQHFRKSPSPT